MPETPKSAYFREMLPYPLEEFRSVLGLNMDSAKKVVSALKRSGVAKAVNRKTFDLDRLTEESEVIEDVAENCVLKCYPKYIDNYSNDPKDESGLVKELRSVLKAIQKHKCGEVFENHFHDDRYRDGVLDFTLPRPQWLLDGSAMSCASRLIPDIMTTCVMDAEKHDEVFCILDGKYYIVQKKNNSVVGNPGVQDVVKQFVYHRAIREHIGDRQVFNAFLFPCLNSELNEGENFLIRGNVTMMDWGTKGNEFVPIYLTFIRPELIWNSYIHGKSCKNELIAAMKKIRYPEDVYGDILKKR